MDVVALSKLIGLVIMDDWTQLRISQGHVGLSYCLLGLLMTIALRANVLELLTKSYTHISDIIEAIWCKSTILVTNC